MAELEKLLCTDSKVESLKKINAIIENGGGDINNKITNCLLEVPQNIKLELNDGTLTLKAGSVVIVPNGFEADGTTPKFDYVTIESDLTMSSSWGTAEKMAIFVSPTGNSLNMVALARLSSGTTAPTATNTQRWYDTNTNLVKAYAGGSYSGSNVSFPIAICTKTSASEDKILASIDQVFNGFGYIGSTVWVDKGVKGLIPNGRNEDGTLRNEELVNSSVKLLTQSGTYNLKLALARTGLGAYYYEFDAVNNYVYRPDTGQQYNDRFIIGDFSTVDGKITSFQPKTTFHAVDYNEAVLKSSLVDIEEAGSTIASLCMPDYSARYTVTTSESSPKTATEDCIFVVDNSGNNSNVCIFVNNLCVASFFASANARSAGYAIVPKGISYYATNYNRTGNPAACTQYIIPLKGTR